MPVLQRLCLGRCSRSAAGGSGDFLTTVILNLGRPQSRVSYLSLVHVLCQSLRTPAPGLETGALPLTKDGQISEPPGWCKGTAAIARETTTQGRFRHSLSLGTLNS